MSAQLPWKIHIFKNNSPWGVIKHPQRGNVYKHIVNIVDPNKRSEFVAKYLSNDTPLNSLTFYTTAFNPINELSFTFKASYAKYDLKYDELTNKDFCVVKKPGDSRHYFYTLEVVEANLAYVTFRAELDIFFTYSLSDLLHDTRESFINRGHIKRYLSNGKIDWNVVLRNKETIAPISKLHNKHLLKYDDNTSDFKWAVMYIKTDRLKTIFKSYKNGSIVEYIYNDLITTFNDRILPYTILVFPISKDLIRKTINIKESHVTNSYVYSGELYNMLIEKYGDDIIGIHLKDGNDLGFDIKNVGLTTIEKTGASSFTIKNDNTSKFWRWTRIKYKQKTLSDFNETNTGARLVNKIKELAPNERTYFLNPAYIEAKKKYNDEFNKWLNRDSQLVTANDGFYHITLLEQFNAYPNKGFLDKTLLVNNNALTNKDPILWAPQHYRLVLKKWNTKSHTYFFPRLLEEVNGNKYGYWIKNIYNWDPIVNKNIFWMEYDLNYKDSVIESDFLEVVSTDSVSTAQNQYESYMRDNKNTFNAAHENKKTALELNRNLAIIGGVGSILSRGSSLVNNFIGGGVPAAALAWGGFLNTELRLKHLAKSRQATIDDLRRRPSDVVIGDSGNLSTFINSLPNRKDDIYILEYGLTDIAEKAVLDYVGRYGYEVGKIANVKTFAQTRTRFNYIEADDVFNDIKLNLSPKIKQTISNAFENGLFIWHYRTANDWKGIKNFTDPNDEYVISKRKKRKK